MKLLVVAKSWETVDWLEERVPPDWLVRVVEKGVDIEDRGREASSFFWAIRRYLPAVDAADRFAFVQGNPFDHWQGWDLDEPIEGFRTLGEHHFESDGRGAPQHPSLPVKQRYEEWFGREFPGSLPFTAGGQFACTGLELLRYSQDEYDTWIERALLTEGPWLMERFWRTIFEG